jgi:hypothetical protein
MINQSAAFVQLCYKVSQKGHLLSFGAGDIVARGFADVGFECFYVRHDLSLLSLLSGLERGGLDEERRHYFLIPSADDLLAELRRLGVEQVTCEVSASPRQVVTKGVRSGQSVEGTGLRIDEALLFLLASCLDLSLLPRPGLVSSRAISLPSDSL